MLHAFAVSLLEACRRSTAPLPSAGGSFTYLWHGVALYEATSSLARVGPGAGACMYLSQRSLPSPRQQLHLAATVAIVSFIECLAISYEVHCSRVPMAVLQSALSFDL